MTSIEGELARAVHSEFGGIQCRRKRFSSRSGNSHRADTYWYLLIRFLEQSSLTLSDRTRYNEYDLMWIRIRLPRLKKSLSACLAESFQLSDHDRDNKTYRGEPISKLDFFHEVFLPQVASPDRDLNEGKGRTPPDDVIGLENPSQRNTSEAVWWVTRSQAQSSAIPDPRSSNVQICLLTSLLKTQQTLGNCATVLARLSLSHTLSPSERVSALRSFS